jgi:hypothetical protein
VGRIVILSMLLVSCGSKPPGPPRTVTVSVAEGDVTQLGEQVTAGSQIAMDEFLVVGDGRVELAMSWAGTLRIFPHSTVLLATALGERRSPDVQLAVGKLWAMIHGLNGASFEVSTSNAVAGVRGTEFIVETDEKASEVYVVEGEVSVHSQAEPKAKQSVKAKQRTRVVATFPAPLPEAHESVVHQTQWRAIPDWPASLPAVAPVTPKVVPQPIVPPPEEEEEERKPSPHPVKKKPAKQESAPPPKPAEEQPPPPPPPPPAEDTAAQGPKRPAFEMGAPTKYKKKKAPPPGQPATNWPPKP